MTAPRNITTQWTGGTTTADVVLPVCAAGDLLVILVGGGNQVVSEPAGWTAYGALTGQEAQGRRFTKTATGFEGGTTVTLTFDGGDRRFIVAAAIKQWDEHTLNFFFREGSVSTTYGPGTLSWNADQYQGDLLLTFVFCRNASQAPTMGRGVLWEEQTSGGSSAALYVESLPAYSLDEPFAVDLPERSGVVSYSMAVYGYTWTDWLQEDIFEVVQPQFSEQAQAVAAHEGSRSVSGGPFPEVDRSDLLSSQGDQEWVEGFSLDPATWEIDADVIVGEGIYTRSWATTRRYVVYASQLEPDDIQPPTSPLAPPEGYWDVEYETEPRVIEVWSKAQVTGYASDTTGDPANGLNPPYQYGTVMRRATGVTWNPMPTSDHIVAWDRTHDPDQIIWFRGPEGFPSVTNQIIPMTDAIDPENQLRLAVVVFVTGSSGSGTPAMNFWDYGTQGTITFGASHGWYHEVSDPDGGLHWLIQPGRSRYLTRRSPVVDVLAPVVPKLRLYPRDDVLGFSGVARQYPPPRRGRNYGQQP